MDGDGNGEDLTPFWVQSTANLRRGDRLRRGFAAVFFSSGLVVFLLLVTAVFFLVFVVPSTLSLSVNIFRPNSVKKSWDSLNVVLVLVAVVFGFLSRNKNEEREKEKERERGSYYDEFRESSIKENESQKSNLSAANQWYGYSDYEAKLEQRNLSLRRNSSSHPDLREVSPTYWGYGDYQRRYYDDIYVDSGRVAEQGQIHHRRHRSLEQVDLLRETPRAKTVFVDTLVSKSMEATNQPSLPSPPLATPDVDEEITNGSAATRGDKSDMGVETSDPISAPKPPLPPPEEYQSPGFEEDQRRTYERVARKRERSSRRRNKNVESTVPITAPPPPPPPPPPEQKSSKSDKKRGGATGNSAKDFLNSLYNKKKKKQRQKSVDNMDSLLHEAQPPISFQIPPPSPPPPPPPPPPPSAFQNLFLSKKQKRKRTITVRLEPYPPAPPPPPPREPKPTSQAAAMKTHKPPKPIKMHSFDKLDEASNSGGESPLNRIPPPPPPPPPAFFKSPAWKFVVEGDYVRVNSSTSSRSGSPDPDETESDVTPSAAAFHPSPLFCPSPDVDTKAESFITNFRAKLKLEKNNSMKRREPGLSSLGPSRS